MNKYKEREGDTVPTYVWTIEGNIN